MVKVFATICVVGRIRISWRDCKPIIMKLLPSAKLKGTKNVRTWSIIKTKQKTTTIVASLWTNTTTSARSQLFLPSFITVGQRWCLVIINGQRQRAAAATVFAASVPPPISPNGLCMPQATDQAANLAFSVHPAGRQEVVLCWRNFRNFLIFYSLISLL